MYHKSQEPSMWDEMEKYLDEKGCIQDSTTTSFDRTRNLKNAKTEGEREPELQVIAQRAE
jgi:hypothetical protein